MNLGRISINNLFKVNNNKNKGISKKPVQGEKLQKLSSGFTNALHNGQLTKDDIKIWDNLFSQ
jgi:hypothetical protein